jgi:thiol-disulfide isomerase/thioredoxin
MNKIIKILLIITTLFFLVGCGTKMDNQTQQSSDSTEIILQNNTTNNIKNEPKSYKSIELLDLNTNQTYKLSDFEDKVVLIESFAIWCPTCTNQQKQLKKLHEINKDVISISLDTDQNEDESEILEHTQYNNFNWRYSISPEELTSYFISNYGISFVSAPSVPILLKCPNQEPIKLKNGLKSVEYLIEQINTCENN